jgi:hypothetical protein
MKRIAKRANLKWFMIFEVGVVGEGGVGLKFKSLGVEKFN